MKKRAPSGHRCGGWHPKARLSAKDVRAMRGDYLAFVRGYEWLANKYGCGVSTARDIVNFRTRVND